MTQEEITRRQDLAEDYFRKGYNCSQSVVAACADLFDIQEDTALRMAASFGGGIGRMRLTCGAASGAFMLEGLHSGSTQENDPQGKKHNYERVQLLAKQFIAENGSLTCSELLELRSLEIANSRNFSKTLESSKSSTPAERTPAYYHDRPCIRMVRSAVKIFLENL